MAIGVACSGHICTGKIYHAEEEGGRKIARGTVGEKTRKEAATTKAQEVRDAMQAAIEQKKVVTTTT